MSYFLQGDFLEQVNSGSTFYDVTIANIDYASYPSQDFKVGGSGNYVIGGVTYSINTTGVGATYGLQNGVGIVMVQGGGWNPSWFSCDMTQLWPGFTIGKPWRMVWGWTGAPTITGTSLAHCGHEDYPNPTLTGICMVWGVRAASSEVYSRHGPPGTVISNTALQPNAPVDTYEMQFTNHLTAVVRAGNRASWPPAAGALTERGSFSSAWNARANVEGPYNLASTFWPINGGVPRWGIWADGFSGTLRYLLLQTSSSTVPVPT